MQLLVYYHAKPGMLGDFIEEIYTNNIQQIVMEEKGCLQYEYFTSLEDPDTMLLVERWETEADQQLHVTQPHCKLLQELKAKYIESTDFCKC